MKETHIAPTLRWWNHLETKLAAFIVVVMLAATGLFVLVEVRKRDQQFVNEMLRSARLLSETTKSGLFHSMVTQDHDGTVEVLKRIGSQKDIQGVRLFAKNVIAFSTHPGETGKAVDKRAPFCIACHAGGRCPTPSPRGFGSPAQLVVFIKTPYSPFWEGAVPMGKEFRGSNTTVKVPGEGGSLTVVYRLMFGTSYDVEFPYVWVK